MVFCSSCTVVYFIGSCSMRRRSSSDMKCVELYIGTWHSLLFSSSRSWMDMIEISGIRICNIHRNVLTATMAASWRKDPGHYQPDSQRQPPRRWLCPCSLIFTLSAKYPLSESKSTIYSKMGKSAKFHKRSVSPLKFLSSITAHSDPSAHLFLPPCPSPDMADASAMDSL